jgi:hypothetical protein
MPVDQALREQFEEQGFVHVPGLLSREEATRWGPIVEAGVQARTASDTRPDDEKTRYERSFRQCINLWEDAPDVRPLTFHPAIAATAAYLLGVDAVRVWHDQALFKAPGGRVTDPHQDQPFWPIVETDTVTAWIALVDVPLAMGAMAYVPGSHRFGVREFANIFTARGFDLENGPEARGVPPVSVPVKAGDVIYHHGLTIHTAGPNESDRTRAAHTVIFFADGCTRGERPRSHPSVDRGDIAVGAPIRSAVTPVAFPRPDGSLPDTPPPAEHPRPNWPGFDWSTWEGLPKPTPKPKTQQ